jgi:hypothetical protein
MDTSLIRKHVWYRILFITDICKWNFPNAVNMVRLDNLPRWKHFYQIKAFVLIFDILREPSSIIVLPFCYKTSFFYVFSVLFSSCKQDYRLQKLKAMRMHGVIFLAEQCFNKCAWIAQHRGKTSAHASTLPVIVLRTWWESVPNVSEGSKWR